MIITIVIIDAIIMTDGLFHLIAAEKYILSSVIMMSEDRRVTTQKENR
jgi:hypothetical protein